MKWDIRRRTGISEPAGKLAGSDHSLLPTTSALPVINEQKH